MKAFAADLTDDQLRRRFGVPVFERGADYFRSGRVLEAAVRADGFGHWIVRGSVSGSGGVPYSVTIDAGSKGGELWLQGSCTCPVVVDCKHVVAVILEARPAPQSSELAWESTLDTLLDELEEHTAPQTWTELGVAVELAERSARGFREMTAAAARPEPRLRVVRRGSRGGWVRTNVSWRSLAVMESRGCDPVHIGALDELLSAYRAHQRMTYVSSDDQIPVGQFGPRLWTLLRRAREAGVTLVPGRGVASVQVLPEAVALELDANAAGDSGETAGVVAQLGVRHAGRWHPVPDLALLGRPTGHGVALFADEDDGPAITLAALRSPAAPQLTRLVANGGRFDIPSSGRQAFADDYLPRLRHHVRLSSSDGSVPIPVQVPPRLVLTVEWSGVSEVRTTWTFRYRRERGPAGEDRRYVIDDRRGFKAVRDRILEQELLARLDLSPEQRHRLCTPGGRLVPDRVLDDLAAIGLADILPGLEQLDPIEVEEIGVRPTYRPTDAPPVITFSADDAERADRLSDRPDWLDLQVVISVGGENVALAHVLEALTQKRERLILASGRHLSLHRPEFAALAQAVDSAGELVDQPRNGVRVYRGDLGLWEELADLGIVDSQAAEWVRAARALTTLTDLPEADPVGLRATLRPYQIDGFKWLTLLWQAQLGGILADDMGLGKTLQTLALMTHARAQGTAPFLVVAPTSVVSTWAHEAATFAPDLVVSTITESRSRRGVSIADLFNRSDVVICSYTLFRMEVADYAAHAWGGLILDEAQTVKNHQGKTYQAVRRIQAPFRLALTGTPLENRLMELWSILSIVAPGLYPYPKRFADEVAAPIEKEGDQGSLERFRKRIRPFVLRRTKEVVATDLPPKQESVLTVPLGQKHRRIYDTHLQKERQRLLGLVDDFDKHRLAIFRSLTRLRQLSLDPGLVDPAYDDIGSAKIDVLADHLHEIIAEGHRALVFSQFTSYLSRVRERLEADGITTTYLDGSTRDRGAVIKSFKEGEGDVFLISLKAGGVGITLTEADYVFVLDPWWNPAVEAQAVDRAHRIGQTRPVMVYRLVSEATIEEKVMELKERKQALFAQVMDGEGGPGTPISAADVRALLADTGAS